ncbi:MAG: hypothetical protein WD800_07805 [Dehalococcoidia bacterium]
MARAKPGPPPQDKNEPPRETKLRGSLARLATGKPVLFFGAADLEAPGGIEAVLRAMDAQRGIEEDRGCPECTRWESTCTVLLAGDAHRAFLAAAFAEPADTDAIARLVAEHGIPAPPECFGTH